jgi:hypothetical protein
MVYLSKVIGLCTKCRKGKGKINKNKNKTRVIFRKNEKENDDENESNIAMIALDNKGKYGVISEDNEDNNNNINANIRKKNSCEKFNAKNCNLSEGDDKILTDFQKNSDVNNSESDNGLNKNNQSTMSLDQITQSLIDKIKRNI